jgi:hypothetical protein
MWAAGSATLEYVRLRQARVDAPVARLRLSYLLSSVTFHPPAMPPSALLVVRSMKDPLPGRIAKEFEAASLPSLEWENAAQEQLGGLFSGAGRPARGMVSSSAEAVLFADYGELFACLARDLNHGSGNAWWWQSVLRRFPSRRPDAWPEVWAEHPLYVPAALQQLEEGSDAAAVLEGIAPTQAWRLLLAVLHAFALPETEFVVSQFMTSLAADTRTADEARQSSERQMTPMETSKIARDRITEGRPDSGLSLAGSVLPPWEPYVAASSAPATLGRARRALLGVSLLLRRAPQVAFSASFPLRLRGWLAQDIVQENLSASRNEPAITSESSVVTAGLTSHAESTAATATSSERSADPTRPLAKGYIRAVSDSFTGIANPVPPPSDEGELGVHTASPVGRLRVLPQASFEAGTFSHACGVFYLIHFLRQTELLRLNTSISGWALLDLLARCLLDQSFQEVSGDAVWLALEQLDGRAHGFPPGLDFQPQITYDAPESWLHEADSQERYVRFRSGRMEIWNSEGFLTLDSQIAAVPMGVVLHPLDRLQRRAWRHATRVCPAGLQLSSELRRFLHFVLPYARWRLNRALGDASLQEVLLRAGTLYVSATHVDIVMGMKQICVPARLAGLDANPGWVPELGRVVTFHFVQEGFGGE